MCILLVFVPLTLLILTMAIGRVLDLPSLHSIRSRLAEKKVRPLAFLVVAGPALSAFFDLPGRVAAVSPIPIPFAEPLSLICGSFFSAALAGCWLAMNDRGRVRRYLAFATSFVVLASDWLLVQVILAFKK